MKIMFYIVPILSISIMIFVFVLMFSAKARGKFMSNQIKSMKKMIDYSEEDLKDLAAKGIDIKKNILVNNEEDLKNISNMEANISKDKIETTARAIKKGLTESDKMYCKHCGSLIDSDSKFCNRCGKEQ